MWIEMKLMNGLYLNYQNFKMKVAHESGLFYRATPDGSLCYKHESLEGSKKAMNRITVLCCCNMAGTDKKSC